MPGMSHAPAFHPSVKRLLDCAVAATAGKPKHRRVTDEASLRVAMGITAQNLYAWKTRGVSKEGQLAALRLFGCSPAFIDSGIASAPHPQPPQPLKVGGPSSLQLRETLPSYGTLTPPHIGWEQLMAGELAAEFQTNMPDASMSPGIRAGARIIFITGVAPRAGDVVLVADQDGTHYVREYRELRAGHWQAYASNPAHLPLDSQRDGLQVLAVFDGMRGRLSEG
jgi:hypothetical protein